MIPHTAIPVTNIERSVTFYSRLGFVVGNDWQRPEWNMHGCFLKHPSGMNIELIHHPKNKDIQYPVTPEVLHLAIPVSNLVTIMNELTKAKILIVRPITPGITVKQLAFIRDPDGLTIELFEPKS